MKNRKPLNLPICLFALFVFTTSWTIHAQVPEYVATDSLRAWYPFNGDANDVSGNNFNLQNLGCTLTEDRFGNPNAAYNLDGEATYLRGVGFPFINQYSQVISFWFRITDPSANGTLISLGGVAHGAIEINLVDDFFEVRNPFQGDVIATSSSVPYEDGNWHHALFLRFAQEFVFVLNTEVVFSDFNFGQGAENDPLIIGSNFELDSYFKGDMDDIGVWSLANNFNTCDGQRLYFAYAPSNPEDQLVGAGGTATFNVNNNPELGFQWQVEGGLGWQNLSNAGQYSGVNTSTLTVSNVNIINDNYLFRCMIDYGNECIEPTSPALLNVSTTSVFENSKANELNVYPNPSTGQFRLDLNGGGFTANAQITVLDNTGRRVFSSTASGVEPIVNLESLAEGMYLIQVQEGGLMGTARIQKIN